MKKGIIASACALLFAIVALEGHAAEAQSIQSSSPGVTRSMLIGIKAEVADQQGYVKTLPVRVLEAGKTAYVGDHPRLVDGIGTVNGFAFEITANADANSSKAQFGVVATQKNTPPATAYKTVVMQDISVGTEAILPIGGGADQHFLILTVTSIKQKDSQ